ELSEAFLAFADGLLGALLVVHILEDQDRPLDSAFAVAEWSGGQAKPDFAPVFRRMDDLDARNDGLAPKRRRRGPAERIEQRSVRVEVAQFVLGARIVRRHHRVPEVAAGPAAQEQARVAIDQPDAYRKLRQDSR